MPEQKGRPHSVVDYIKVHLAGLDEVVKANPTPRPHWGRRLAALLLLAGLAGPAAWAAPYAYVANGNSNTVSVINTATDQVTATVTVGASPYGVAVSPDGSRVYVANGNSNTVSVINTASNTVTATVAVGFSPYGVAVTPDGSRVYVANRYGGTVSVIDAATDQVTATVTVGTSPIGVAVSPDGSRVYVANLGSGTVSVIDTATDQVTATVTVGVGPIGVAVSPDGSQVYVANNNNGNNGTVSVIDTATDTVTATVTVGSSPYGVAVSPDGSRVYVANGNSYTVSVIDTATDQVTATATVGTLPFGVAVSSDGSRVYVANGNSNTVSVIDTATDAVTSTVTVGTNPVSLGNFVGPGALIATNSSASGNAGNQISGAVQTLGNTTSCITTDVAVQGPRHGSVILDANTGAYTYTPNSATYSGPDSFTWVGQTALVCSAANSPTLPVSNTATVSLRLNPLLTGLGDVTLGENASTQESFSLAGSPPFTHTLASDNDTVLPPASVTITPATCGTAGNLDCTLAITAGAVPGTASVAVAATDRYGNTVKKTVLVTVAAPTVKTTPVPPPSGGGGGGAISPLGLLGLALLVALAGWGRRRLRRKICTTTDSTRR